MTVFMLLIFYCISGITLPSAPDITGILVPINVDEATSTETLLDVFTVADVEHDAIVACALTGDDDKFDLRQLPSATDNFELFLLSSANLNYDSKPSYTLNVTCTDSAGDSSSTTLTIDIIPNQSPTLVAPSAPVNINENERVQRRIYTVNVTDPEGDAVSCTIRQVIPPVTIFGIWKGSTDYDIYLLNNPNLNYDLTSSYIIRIECYDAYGSASTNLTVDVEENSPPWFTNLPTGTNLLFDASSTPAGTSIFTVICNDTDSTTLTYTMTSSPTSSDLFEINTDTGKITASKDLIYAVDSSHDLTVSVSDGDLSISEVLRVELTNVNTAPVITNLPDTISISEETVGGTSIFKLKVTDPDAKETISCTWSLSPSVYTSKFSLDDKTYVLRLKENETLDYEIRNIFIFTFSVSDQKAKTGPYYLTLNLIDENEPCYFDKATYYVTTYEAGRGGGKQDPGFIVIDPDEGDTYTLKLVTAIYSDLFRIDSVTGELSFDTDYDVDQGIHPTNVTLTVECEDQGGETGSATLNVTVEDLNDNIPEFGKTGYVIYCDQWDAPGTTIGTLKAQDSDSGNNADIEYSWVPQSATGSVYYILSPNGGIILKVDPTTRMSYGDTHRFLVTAKDQGSPSLSSTTTVDVVYKESTTTTSADEVATVTFSDGSGNVAWAICAAILAAVFMSLLLYILIKYCGLISLVSKTFKTCNCSNTKCCRIKSKTKSIRKVMPKPDPKPTPFDFWNDSDMFPKNNKPFTGKDTFGPLPKPAPVE